MQDLAVAALLLSSLFLMVILSYINYRILHVTIYMLEVTIDIKDVSSALLEETKNLRESFIVKEKDINV